MKHERQNLEANISNSSKNPDVTNYPPRSSLSPLSLDPPFQETGDSKPFADAASRAKVVAVGDSLPHDVLGALRARIASVFVAGGVHFEELGVEQGGVNIPSAAAYAAAFSKHLEGEGVPTHVVPAFRW